MVLLEFKTRFNSYITLKSVRVHLYGRIALMLELLGRFG